MAKVLKSDLSVSGINDLIAKLKAEKQRIINLNISFCEKMIECGYKVEYSELGKSAILVNITKTLNSSGNICKASLVAKDGQVIISRWRSVDSNGNPVIRQEEVSPLWMAEFGSGQYNKNPYNIEGGNRGDFPNQKHAFEPQWSWVDLNGVKHTSSGIKPTQPVYTAFTTMYVELQSIAKEVWR